jgi:hypothetical protein
LLFVPRLLLKGLVVVAMSWRDRIGRFLGFNSGRARPDGVKPWPADDIDPIEELARIINGRKSGTSKMSAGSTIWRTPLSSGRPATQAGATILNSLRALEQTLVGGSITQSGTASGRQDASAALCRSVPMSECGTKCGTENRVPEHNYDFT